MNEGRAPRQGGHNAESGPIDKSINIVQGTDDSLPGCLGEIKPIWPNHCRTCEAKSLCQQMRCGKIHKNEVIVK